MVVYHLLYMVVKIMMNCLRGNKQSLKAFLR